MAGGVKRKSRRDRYLVKITAVWVVVLMTCIVEIFFYTWCSVQCTRLRYEIGRQEKLTEKLEAEQKELRIEIARLKSPARIIGIARDKLGMVIPETDQVIVIP